MRILLTGANGFVGRALYKELISAGHTVICVVRKKHMNVDLFSLLPENIHYFDALDRHTDFTRSLTDIDVVVHLAARAHMPTRTDFDMHKDFLEINFFGTINLAKQAAEKKVKRFVFISSIGVHGKSTPGGHRYSEEDVEKPYNSYTISKLKSENALWKISRYTGMEVVVIRPPLVYGPRVKANFFKLMALVHTGLPLPFAGIKNVRSFIAIDNLVDAVSLCVVHPKAGGEVFIVCDNEALSTTRLLEKISAAMGARLRLFYCPPAAVKTMAAILQKQGIYNRLWGNLVTTSAKIEQCLGWKPGISVDEGIQKTVLWYCEQKHDAWNCLRTR